MLLTEAQHVKMVTTQADDAKEKNFQTPIIKQTEKWQKKKGLSLTTWDILYATGACEAGILQNTGVLR